MSSNYAEKMASICLLRTRFFEPLSGHTLARAYSNVLSGLSMLELSLNDLFQLCQLWSSSSDMKREAREELRLRLGAHDSAQVAGFFTHLYRRIDATYSCVPTCMYTRTKIYIYIIYRYVYVFCILCLSSRWSNKISLNSDIY